MAVKYHYQFLSSSPKSSCGQNTILLTKQLRICANVSVMSYQGWGGALLCWCQEMLTIHIVMWKKISWKWRAQSIQDVLLYKTPWKQLGFAWVKFLVDCIKTRSWAGVMGTLGKGGGNLTPDVSPPRNSRNIPEIFSTAPPSGIIKLLYCKELEQIKVMQ